MPDTNVLIVNNAKRLDERNPMNLPGTASLAFKLHRNTAKQMLDTLSNTEFGFAFFAFALVLPLLGGCLFSPDLSVDEDEFTAPYPPVIFSSADPFEFPGPLLINRGETRILSVTVLDNDIDDTIFMRLYVDYTLENPLPALSECSAPSSEFEARILTTCPMSAVCNLIPVGADDELHILEALVSDSPFVTDSDPIAEGQPAFRAIADPVNSTPVVRSWPFRCVENN